MTRVSAQPVLAPSLGSGTQADETTAHLFVRDLVLSAAIGIHPHEQHRRQRVRLNLDLTVDDWTADAVAVPEEIGEVVSYEMLVDAARRLVAERHWPLVETVAEHLAAAALADPRVRDVRVRVEKLDAFANAAAVGVEIMRRRPIA